MSDLELRGRDILWELVVEKDLQRVGVADALVRTVQEIPPRLADELWRRRPCRHLECELRILCPCSLDML